MILRESYQLDSTKEHAMTTAHDIDLRQLVEDRLTGASPDLLRELLTMFIHALMGAEADACAAPTTANAPTNASTFATATGTATSTPASAPSTWPSPSCGPARTSRTGCCNGASGPNEP